MDYLFPSTDFPVDTYSERRVCMNGALLK
jgi:hypothetical protein